MKLEYLASVCYYLDMKKSCQKCGEEFRKSVFCSKKDWKGRKYCSKSCSNSVNSKGNKHMLGRVSLNKGKKFPQYSGKNNPNWKGGDITKTCKQCGNVFTRALNRKGRTAKYCTKKCSEIDRDEGKSTINNRIRKSKEYKLWRTAVFERDDYTCIWCGIRGNYLNADHIKPFALFPELRFAIDNGRTLCVDCHKKTGTWGRCKIFRAVANET